MIATPNQERNIFWKGLMRMRGLVLAEKPSLMRAIQSGYSLCSGKLPFTLDFAAFHGHLMGLAQPGDYHEEWKKWDLAALPLIPEPFKYLPIDKESVDKIMVKIRTGKYDFLVNACDAEREGEHIFWSFYEANGLTLPVKRLWCSTTLPSDLAAALKKLHDASEFQHLRESAAFRAQFDWLAGMNFSRAISLKTNKKSNIGRVMTPTLKIVVDRELEIRNFVPQAFYEVMATMVGGTKKEKFPGIVLIPPELKQTRFPDKQSAERTKTTLGKTGTVTYINGTRKENKAPTLYSTTELEKDANKYFKFRASKTDAITQTLYEAGYVTYPRTSCRFIPTSMVPEIPKLLKPLEKWPELADALKLATPAAIAEATKGKDYVDDSKLTDHHAIIPTSAVFDPNTLSADQQKIYLLIAKRFLSIFLPPYVVSNTTMLVESNGVTIKATGRTVVDKGYSMLYQNKAKDVILPPLSKGDEVDITDASIHEGNTKPPDRYTDRSLLDAMANAGKFVTTAEQRAILREAEGIGTPATRSAILEKLESTGMCRIEKGTFIPTSFGMELIDLVKDREIASPAITANWEQKLKDLEENGHPEVFKAQMVDYIKKETDDIIDKVSKDLSAYRFETIGACPLCGRSVIMTDNYYRCSNYKGGKDPCTFIISRKEVFGIKLTKADVVTMLGGKATKEKKLKTKDGREFTAALIIKDGRVSPAFAENKPQDSADRSKFHMKKGICKCPLCEDGQIFPGKSWYTCSNRGKGCKFIVGMSICAATITEEDIKALVAGKPAGPKTFTWKSGKQGTAKLKSEVITQGGEKDFKVGFDFS